MDCFELCLPPLVSVLIGSEKRTTLGTIKDDRELVHSKGKDSEIPSSLTT